MAATRRTALLTLVAMALWTGAAWAAGPTSKVTDRYDDTFRKYAKRYFGPGYDWRIFKAQAMAESGLDPDAKSGAGAVGIMQLLPSTLLAVRSQNKDLATIDDVSSNIAAGICHDRELWDAFVATVDPHRQSFTLGGYNAGETTLRRAQRIAHDRELDERLWPSIEVVAPAVPKWRWQETVEYLRRIRANLARMDRTGRVN